MRTRKHLALLAGLVALLLVAAACSGSPAPEAAQGDGTRLGQKQGKKKAAAGNRKDGSKKKRQRGDRPGGRQGGGGAAPGGVDGAEASPPPAEGGAAAPSGGGFASSGPPSPVDPSLARRSASAQDGSNDAQKEGLTPAYAELLGASIQGLGQQFEMRLDFGGNVPDRTEDKNTIMVIGFGISAGGNDTYGFTAQASPEGWKAYAGAKHKARKFPGEFRVEGQSIVMRVPWKFIDGPREFKWQVNSTWFKSVANTTHYAFDMVPDKEAAQFPN